MSARIAADLRAAADVLERDGWGRDTYTNRVTGCHCLMGAVLTVHGDPHGDGYHGDPADPVQQARDFLNDFLGRAPVRWNDDPRRTADEVIATLRAAADQAEVTR